MFLEMIQTQVQNKIEKNAVRVDITKLFNVKENSVIWT